MRFGEVEIGRLYGVRDKQNSYVDEPVWKVKVIDKLSDKKRFKVRYLEGQRAGLEEFLRSKHFLGRWSEVKAILRDENRLGTLKSISDKDFNPVIWEAIEHVVDAMEDPFLNASESLRTPRLQVWMKEASRIEQRFGLEPLQTLHPAAFVDRGGHLNLPFPTAEALAKKMAEKEPEPVLLALQQDEEELLARGYEPGHRISHEFLRQRQPAFAVVRQWAGIRSEADLLTKEVDRLRQLVSAGIQMLKDSGADTQARRLERALFGG